VLDMSWKDQDIIKVLEDNKYYKFEIDSKGSKLVNHKSLLGYYDRYVIDKQELSDEFIIQAESLKNLIKSLIH